jgi:ABC-2 type transport system permease protein
MTAPAVALPGALPIGLARGALELRGFFRSREAVVFTFAMPTVLMALLGSVFGNQLAAFGITSAQVLAAGMIAGGIMSTTFVSLGSDIALDREDGTLKRLRGTPMPAVSYFLGKFVLVVVTTVGQVAILLTVARLLFGLALPATAAAWLTFAWVAALGTLACSLIGIAISGLARDARSGVAVTQLPHIALQFISGVFVTPLTALPVGLVVTASFFPVKWMAQGFRSVFLPDSMKVFEPAGSWELGRIALVLGAWCVLGSVLCLTTFRWRRGRDG